MGLKGRILSGNSIGVEYSLVKDCIVNISLLGYKQNIKKRFICIGFKMKLLDGKYCIVKYER